MSYTLYLYFSQQVLLWLNIKDGKLMRWLGLSREIQWYNGPYVYVGLFNQQKFYHTEGLSCVLLCFIKRLSMKQRPYFYYADYD